MNFLSLLLKTPSIPLISGRLFLFSLLLLFFSGCADEKDPEIALEQPTPEVYTLASEKYGKTLSLSGTIEADKNAAIASKIGGRLQEIFVDVGDRVEEGQIIANIASDEVGVQYQNSLTNELNTEAMYSSQKIYLDEQVKNAVRALDVAKANLDAAEDSSGDTEALTQEQVALSQKAVDQAREALEQTKNIADQRIESLYQNASSEIRRGLITATDAVNFIDDLLNISPHKKTTNDSYRMFLGLSDPQSRQTAINKAQPIVLHEKDRMQELYNEKIEGKDLSYEDLNEYLRETREYLEDILEVVKEIQFMLDESVTSASFSESQLASLKSENIRHASALENALFSSAMGSKSGVKGVLLSLDEIMTQNTAEISAAEQGFLQAEQALRQMEAGKNQNLSSLQNQILIAEKQYEQAKSALASARAQRDAQLKSLDLQLDMAKGNRELAAETLDNTKVIAPFSGVITEKLAEVGQVVSPGVPLLSVADVSAFQVVTDVSDSSIASLSLGLSARVIIDGNDEEFSAEITKIYPQVDPLTRKLPVEFTLFDAPNTLKVGMFAEVKVDLSKEEAFFVPRAFVHSDFEGAYVFVVESEDVDPRKVFVERGEEKEGMVRIDFEGIENQLQIINFK